MSTQKDDGALETRDVLTRLQVMAYLQISHSTMNKLIKQHELPHIRLGKKLLFRKVDIDAFLESKLTK